MMDHTAHAPEMCTLLALEAEYDRRAREGEIEHYGLILVDLVGLGAMNSRYGREVADEVLATVGRRLREFCPEACVARVEADKFGVLMTGLDQDGAALKGYHLKQLLHNSPWRHGQDDLEVKVRVTCVSGPSSVGEVTNLLWEAQRVHRARRMWEMTEKMKNLENLARLYGVEAQLGAFQTQLAINMAHHDPLTGALNRRGFEELHRTLAAPYALAFVDIDNLREINSVQGDNWEAGDSALVAVKLLLDGVSDTGVVVRWGGDEFLLCLPGMSDETACASLTSLLHNPSSQIHVGELPVSFSGGVAYVAEASQYESAMRRAQGLAKEAKNSGRSRIAIAPH